MEDRVLGIRCRVRQVKKEPWRLSHTEPPLCVAVQQATRLVISRLLSVHVCLSLVLSILEPKGSSLPLALLLAVG